MRAVLLVEAHDTQPQHLKRFRADLEHPERSKPTWQGKLGAFVNVHHLNAAGILWKPFTKDTAT